MSHIGGFVGGLILGKVVLKNFRVFKFERVVFWVSLVIFLLLVIGGIIVNATNATCKVSECKLDTDPLPEYIEKLWQPHARSGAKVSN